MVTSCVAQLVKVSIKELMMIALKQPYNILSIYPIAFPQIISYYLPIAEGLLQHDLVTEDEFQASGFSIKENLMID
jgi:hypothetical protein